MAPDLLLLRSYPSSIVRRPIKRKCREEGVLSLAMVPCSDVSSYCSLRFVSFNGVLMMSVA